MEILLLIVGFGCLWALVAAASRVGSTLWGAGLALVDALTDMAYDLFGDLGFENETWFRMLVMVPVGILLAVLVTCVVALAYKGPLVILGSLGALLFALALGAAADPNRGDNGDNGPKLPLNL